jgi:hypothetical protein
VSDISATLEEEYDAEHDVVDLFSEMHERGLVRVVSEQRRYRASVILTDVWLSVSSPVSATFPEVPPWSTHSDEVGLLFACSRTTTRNEEEVRDLVTRDLDWSFVLEQAARHGVDPMVYHHLHRLENGEVPPDVRETLRARRETTLAHNLHRLRKLLQVIERLDAEDIPTLSFKGPLLAERYYENLGFRRFVDLDLLVPRADLHRADAALRARGFEPPTERPDGEIARRIEDQVGVELWRPEDDLVVELHWALLNKSFAFPLGPDEVWTRAENYSVGSTDVCVLAEEDLLLYLCAHGTKHHWARLKWICDVAEVCRRASLDWGRLLARADQRDLDRLLGLGLRLAERWLDAPVPTDLQARFRDDATLSELVRHVETEWLLTADGLDRTPRWDQLFFFLRTRRRWQNRWPLLREYGALALTPTDTDRAVVDLPPTLSFLYYLIRPFRVLGGGGPKDDAAP